MLYISPGVYSKVTDKSEFLAVAPGSIGFSCILSDQGPDKMQVITSKDQFIQVYGEPNFSKFGTYAQAKMAVENFVDIIGSYYVLRCCADDAKFSNLMVGIDKTNPTKPIITMTSLADIISVEAAIAAKDAITTTYTPIAFYMSKFKGEKYNDIFVRLSPTINVENTYNLDIYKKDNDTGIVELIETFDIAYDKNVKDISGVTKFGDEITERFSNYLQMYINSTGWTEVQTMKSGADVINLQNTAPTSGRAEGDKYIVGPLVPIGDAWAGHENEIAIWNDVGSAWVYTVPVKGEVYWKSTLETDGSQIKWIFDGDTWDVFDPGTALFSPASVSDTSYKQIKEGSDGDLFNVNGTLNEAKAEEYLVKGYSGLIDSQVMNTEYVDFDLVFECAYPTSVKAAAVVLASTVRRDCVALVDNGDQTNIDDELMVRNSDNAFNTYLAAIYCNYSKVYNPYIGAYSWMSPIYHMSRIIALTHQAGNIWDAPAGFARASIQDTNELRYYPNRGDLDRLYLKQLNPVAKFREGYVMWGQLTSQSKQSSLSDLNFVITLNRIKRSLERFCNNYIFEPNNDNNNTGTWTRIKNNIGGFLNYFKSQGGIKDYKLEVGAIDYEFKNKICHVRIELSSNKVIEKIYLNFVITE